MEITFTNNKIFKQKAFKGFVYENQREEILFLEKISFDEDNKLLLTARLIEFDSEDNKVFDKLYLSNEDDEDNCFHIETKELNRLLSTIGNIHFDN